jgi:RimJ/RimL family protein N-acetyltransferase
MNINSKNTNRGLHFAMHRNELGMPIGFPMADWVPLELPPRTPMEGNYCRLEPFDVARHAEDLFHAYRADTESRLWIYVPSGPFDDFEAFRHWAEESCRGADSLVHTVIDLTTKKAVGVASFLGIDPSNGVIEVGAIKYAPALQRTTAGTEAMYLMMNRVFDELGYRRYEWQCNNLNAASKRAAERYGFTFEGVFRQAAIVKGRNRDTAWFAIIDKEWPAIKGAFEAWLSPENFNDDGLQRKALRLFMPT